MRISTIVLLVSGAFACGSGGGGDIALADGGTADAKTTTDGGVSTEGGRSDGGSLGGCRADEECRATAEVCMTPEQPSCGGELSQDCTSDAQCADAGADKICAPLACGGTRCAPKCKSDADCTTKPVGSMTCNVTTGHCVQKSCTTDADCPPNFACADGTPVCTRKSCTSDSQCSGACVNRTCYGAAGTCQSTPN